jgi:hypothetical protein
VRRFGGGTPGSYSSSRGRARSYWNTSRLNNGPVGEALLIRRKMRDKNVERQKSVGTRTCARIYSTMMNHTQSRLSRRLRKIKYLTVSGSRKKQLTEPVHSDLKPEIQLIIVYVSNTQKLEYYDDWNTVRHSK